MAEIKEWSFEVEGIVCSGCALDVQNILQDMDGVTSATVDFTHGRITVFYDPTATGESELLKKIRKIGLRPKSPKA